MKTSNAIAAPAFAGAKDHVSVPQRLRGLLGDMRNAWRAAAEERRMRRALAELDDTMLRDIGIAPDEIARVRAEERFTPRAWADRVGRDWYA